MSATTTVACPCDVIFSRKCPGSGREMLEVRPLFDRPRPPASLLRHGAARIDPRQGSVRLPPCDLDAMASRVWPGDAGGAFSFRSATTAGPAFVAWCCAHRPKARQRAVTPL